MRNQSMSMYYRGRAYHREIRNRHIKRKKRIAQNYHGWGYEIPDGCWSKGKVQCSCGMCTFRGRTYSDMKKDVSNSEDLNHYYAGEYDEQELIETN